MRSDAVPDTSPARALVDAGAICTPYLRAGVGAPLVLLGAREEAAGASPLLVRLSARFRVVAPEPGAWCGGAPNGDAPGHEGAVPSFAAWLRGFLDGLGIQQASIVAREELALRALSFSLTDPLRVDRLVLLYRDAVDPAVRSAAATQMLGTMGHALLLRREPLVGADDDGLDDVVRFLRGEDVAA